MEPTTFNVISTVIFALAIIHTLLTPTIHKKAQAIAVLKQKDELNWKRHHFSSELLYFFGEVEVVFGLWLIPLFFCFAFFYGWVPLLEYLNNRNFIDPLYLMVIVAVIGTRPIMVFAEQVLEMIARIGNDSAAAWWWTLLTITPLLGAFIKEPGAMALASFLLVKKFYAFKPSSKLAHVTLALLFINVSIGGIVTYFSSRSFFIIAKNWDYDFFSTFLVFGWKSILAILLANSCCFLFFRKEFKNNLPPFIKNSEQTHGMPIWITLTHVVFLIAIALTSSYPVIFVGLFLIFLGFYQATLFYQEPIHMRRALLVGFFFASLIVHGQLQGWWVGPMLKSASYLGTFVFSGILSAFIDNATVAYVFVNLPFLDKLDHYLLTVGAMSSGGLTVIANAPNPIGVAILRDHFEGGLSFAKLFLAACVPTIIVMGVFWLLKAIPPL
jgi:hypothetical protein